MHFFFKTVFCGLIFLNIPALYGRGNKAIFQQQSVIFMAQNALKLGLPSLSENLLSPMVLADSPLTEQIRLTLATACLAQQKMGLSEYHLLLMPNFYDNPKAQLYQAIIAWRKGEKLAFWSLLNRWQKSDFTLPAEKAWYVFFQSLLYQPFQALRAQSYLDEITGLSSGEQGKLFSILRLQTQVNSIHHSANLALTSIENFLENFPKGTFDSTIAYRYVSLLVENKDLKKALRFIDEKIKPLKLKNKSERLRFLMLKASLQQALGLGMDESIVEAFLVADQNPRLFNAVLQLWLNSGDFMTEPQARLNTLRRLLDRNPQLKQNELIILLQATLLLQNGKTEEAQKELDEGLNVLTGNFRKQAYILLAQINFSKSVPNYRLAADCLKEAQFLVNGTPEESLFAWMRADIHFLNKDYELACILYEEALTKNVSKDESETNLTLAYQWILCAILQDHAQGVEKKIEQGLQNGWLGDTAYWAIETFYLETLIKKRELAKALSRIESVYAKGVSSTATEAYLFYLKANCLYLESKFQNALDVLEKIGPCHLLENNLCARIWLLKGNSLKQLNQPQRALERYQAVRSFGSSIKNTFLASAFFEEANIYGQQRAYSKAQGLLLELAEKHEAYDYAPLALYQAAVNCEERGLLYAKETADILNRLIERYPKSELCYHAQLKQGALLMALNQVAAAKSLYKNLRNSHPTHEKKYFCEFLEIKCGLLEKGADSKIFIPQLEMLLTYPRLPDALYLEIIFHLSLLYKEIGDHPKIEKTLWEAVHKFLIAKPSIELSEKVAYWLSRCLFQLAELLTSNKKPNEANTIYQLIVRFSLPGTSMAKQALEESFGP